VDTAGLTTLWARAWGDCRPVSYELRGCLHDRWVRFHSLRGSKRYADNEEEYAEELMRRHMAVLAELLSLAGGDRSRELVVVTASWSGPRPAPRAAELTAVLPAATYWTSVLTDDSIPADEVWLHLWASAGHLHGGELPRLLGLVADDVTRGVIITTAEMGWLYAPYDGGADVIAASPGHRDQLRRAHEDWLSAHPSGL
jgi:hypothetical protein